MGSCRILSNFGKDKNLNVTLQHSVWSDNSIHVILAMKDIVGQSALPEVRQFKQ